MNAPTNISAREQSAFDRALAEYLRAREALDAMPVDTTSSEDEQLAMDAMAAAERLTRALQTKVETGCSGRPRRTWQTFARSPKLLSPILTAFPAWILSAQ